MGLEGRLLRLAGGLLKGGRLGVGRRAGWGALELVKVGLGGGLFGMMV